MSPCQPCLNLSVQHLVDLAMEEFVFGDTGFPKSAFYQHHASFDELEQAALFGCDLCRLILDLSKGYNDTGWLLEWQPDAGNISNSMYASAKALEVSDVKLALASSYYYIHAGGYTDHPRILDVLHVQVGPAGDDDATDDEWTVPVLRLMLIVPRNTPVYIRGIQVGRFQTDADLGSAENFDLARHWLKTCRESHKDCLSSDVPPLPTRVVDVGTSNGTEPPRVIHSHGAKAEYTALSHCWGGTITPLLTTTTLATFGKALPYDELPANFRDAIIITRELGVQYLWIDSLCILQDSPQDWADESQKMGHVYGNSTLTISAMASSKSTDGILLHRGTSSPLGTPRPATLEVLTDSDGRCVTMTVEWEGADKESLSTLELDAPLSLRGWTLQEAILSPRRLFYGENRIYWRCPGSIKSAAAAHDLTEGPNTPDILLTNVSSVLHHHHHQEEQSNTPPPPPPHQNTVLDDYYWLVRTYCTRSLTFPSDKLPAFSGLAQRLQPAVGGGDYLAGLWSSDIKNGLLWRSDIGYCRHHLTRPYRAPSWSWAVTDDPVVFDYLEEEEEDLKKKKPFDMRLLEYNVTPRDRGNPFGQIEGGAYLVVEGFVRRLVRTRQILTCGLAEDDPSLGRGSFDVPLSVDGANPTEEELEELRGKGYLSSTNLYQIQNAAGDDCILSILQPTAYCRRFAECELDTFEVDADAFLLEEECLAFLVRHERNKSGMEDEAGEGYPYSFAQCLALRRVTGQSGDDAYERIGHIVLDGQFDREWLESWESKTLTII